MRYDWDYGIPDKYTVVLTPGEADTLAKLLKKEQRALQKRVEKYRDLRDGGEATSRQQTALCEAEYVLEIVEQFIKYGLIKEDKEERI